jgi:hypothetical protein
MCNSKGSGEYGDSKTDAKGQRKGQSKKRIGRRCAFVQYLWWLGTESNCRHADFQFQIADLKEFTIF